MCKGVEGWGVGGSQRLSVYLSGWGWRETETLWVGVGVGGGGDTLGGDGGRHSLSTLPLAISPLPIATKMAHT
jgi:hypothetical protein